MGERANARTFFFRETLTCAPLHVAQEQQQCLLVHRRYTSSVSSTTCVQQMEEQLRLRRLHNHHQLVCFWLSVPIVSANLRRENALLSLPMTEQLFAFCLRSLLLTQLQHLPCFTSNTPLVLFMISHVRQACGSVCEWFILSYNKFIVCSMGLYLYIAHSHHLAQNRIPRLL